jgi:hypothetical protein
MTQTINNTELVNEVKNFIVKYSFIDRWNKNSQSELSDQAQGVIELVSMGGYGFASDVATSAAKYKKVSEKQAYWIAKAAVENNLITRIQSLLSAA